MTIKQKLTDIGRRDGPPATASGDDGSMMERSGTRLDEVEIRLLGDFLERMLRLQPQDKIKMSEVVAYPWFAFHWQ